jgi:hypothetical protein
MNTEAITKKLQELEQGRTSSNNMLCLVPYEPLPESVQEEIEEILSVAN